MASDAWIVSSGRVLASALVAGTRHERRRGLLGRDVFEGAFVLPRCRWIHTVGMQFPIDAAFLDENGRVIRIANIEKFRVFPPVRGATTVLEARRGCFERWNLRLGDVIEIRPITDPLSMTDHE